MSPERVSVIGSGVMGSGIAQTLATAGYPTVCYDVASDALDKAREQVRTGRYGFERAVQRGKLKPEEAEAALARLEFSDSIESAASADLIVECVPERIDLKIRVLRDLDQRARPEAILASNTSGFAIAALAAATERPEKVIGWHWASPPVVMRFAEIVTTRETSDSVRDTVVAVAKKCGKNPIVVRDQPQHWGFVANRVYFAMVREAQRVVDEGVASAEEVNQLMVDCFNWPVGPFAMVKGASEGWQ